MTAPARRRRPAKTKKYHWFQGASVRELYDRLTHANPDTAVLKVYQEGKAMTLTVKHGEVGTAVHELDHINESHLCPPDCG